MPDKGHIETDKILNDLEKKLDETYEQAAKEMGDKLNKQTQKYQKKLDEMNEKLANGTISKDTYMKWKQSQSIQTLHLEQICNTLAEDLTHTDEIAAAIINGHTPGVYALNYNFSTYEIEKGINASTSFVLYNHETVEHILKDNPDLLPQPKINIAKDLKWNKQHINNAITQGILQGESIPKISKRMVEAVGMSRNSAIRNARTATTGAQSMGRVDAYKRAENMGINVKQKWLATLDGRTRHTHRLIDGEIVDVGSKFSNDCRFPGDPQGPGYEVYNCRCTLVPVLKGFERPDDWKQQIIDYDAWKEGGNSFGKWLEDQAAPDSAIQSIWGNKKMSQMYNEIKAINTTDANKFYKELGKLGKPSETWEKYLSGQLDAEDLKSFEEILKKYLPKETPLDDYAEWLKQWQGKSILSADVPFSAVHEINAKFLNAGYINPSQYWNKYLAQEIKDPDLDKILGYKKLDKLADTAKTVNKIDNISDIAEAAQDSLNNLKIKAGNPMTKAEADNYKVNPFYDIANEATTKNCQTSAFAYECRRQGYDVVALPRDKTLKYQFELQNKLAEDQKKAWINVTTGKSPEAIIKSEFNLTVKKGDMLKELGDTIGSDNERYILSVRWKNGGAHAVNIDRDENGLLRIIDNQRGPLEKNTWVGSEVEDYFDNVKNIKNVYRVDDCIPNSTYFNNILADASKIKINTPMKLSDLTDYKTQVNKIIKTAKSDFDTPAEYYKKWQFGKVDNKDLDDLLVKSQTSKVTTSKTDDLLSVLNKDLSDKTWLDAWEVLENKGASDDTIDAISHKLYSIKKDQNIATKNEVLDLYLKGKIKDSELDDLFGEVYNISTKKVDIPDVIKKFEFVDVNTGEVLDTLKEFEKIKKMQVTDIDDMADKLVKKYDIEKEKAKELLKNSGLNIPEKKVTPTPVSIATPKAGTTVVDMDAIKNKKVTQVYNEIKADMSSKEANAFYSELKNIGKADGLKQGDVWAKYLKGELDADDVAKIDKHLVGKYGKIVEPPKPEVDYFTLSNKKMSQVYNELKAENVTDANKFYNELKKHGKPSEVWEKYVNGELSEDVTSKVDSYLINKYNKGGTTASKTVAKAAAKSDDLAKAEAELKKVQDEFAKIPNKKYSGIWKDDVTLADYEQKKETIAAKKIYYEDEIDKLKNDPSYKSYLSDMAKNDYINNYTKWLKDLDEFEEKGKEYAKFQKAVKDAQDKVAKASPTSEMYTQARKDAAKWYTKNTYSQGDKYYDEWSRNIHAQATSAEKSAYRSYTSASGGFNRPLAGFEAPAYSGSLGWDKKYYKGPGKVNLNQEGKGKQIKDLTTFIEKSKTPDDIWIQTAQNFATFEGPGGKGFLPGVKYGDLAKMSDGELQKFVGVESEFSQFVSGSINKGGGSYTPGDVRINIYCPRNSEALYVLEDGTFGKREHEIILQRGGSYRITKIYWGKDTYSGSRKLMVDMELRYEKGYDKF